MYLHELQSRGGDFTLQVLEFHYNKITYPWDTQHSKPNVSVKFFYKLQLMSPPPNEG